MVNNRKWWGDQGIFQRLKTKNRKDWLRKKQDPYSGTDLAFLGHQQGGGNMLWKRLKRINYSGTLLSSLNPRWTLRGFSYIPEGISSWKMPNRTRGWINLPGNGESRSKANWNSIGANKDRKCFAVFRSYISTERKTSAPSSTLLEMRYKATRSCYPSKIHITPDDFNQ